MEKTISLQDFRKVFTMVSPWRSAKQVLEPSMKDNASSIRSSVTQKPVFQDFHIPLTDRIFYYCSFQYHYVQRQKIYGKGKLESPKISQDIGFNVDVTAMVHVLDTIMKQPLQARLRFFFDLHDLDGDSALSRDELKSAMDSLLEMFEKSRQLNDISDTRSSAGSKQNENEELYLAAVSSFLASALKLGKEATSGAAGQMRRTSSTSFNTPNNRGSKTSRPLPKTGLAIESPLAEEEGELDEITAETGQLDLSSSKAVSPVVAVIKDEDLFRLGFNEFLLAVLSQSVFVEFFERIWTLKSLPSGEVLLSRIYK
jgi:hypothetical protein